MRRKFFLFLRFFCGTHFCEGPGVPWTVGLQSNPTQAYKCGSVELWETEGWGGWGNKQWGKHSIRPAIVVFLQRGAGAKNIFIFAIFFAEPIFAKGTKPNINIFFAYFFFATKQHVGPGINYFRK